MRVNSLLNVTALSFHHVLKTFLEPSSYVARCVINTIYENFLDLGHQFDPDAASKAADVFLNRVSLTVIYEETNYS